MNTESGNHNTTMATIALATQQSHPRQETITSQINLPKTAEAVYT